MQSKNQFPSLQQLATEVVSRNYNLYPSLEGIPERIKEAIIEKSIQFSPQGEQTILMSAPHVHQQKFWKAFCHKDPKLMSALKLQEHGFSFKVAFLEHFVHKLLATITNYEKERDRVQRVLKAAAPWVYSLQLRLNVPDMQIHEIISYLYNIINLKVKCCEGKNQDYHNNIIGMKYAEARDLAEALKHASDIICLNLSGNLIDDELLKFIHPGLLLNSSLVELNLSYNKVANEGARKLAKILLKNQVLVHLNLTSNCIGEEGSRYIAQALKLNSTLQYLSLKLNSIQDKPAAKFFKDIVLNTSLLTLDFQANRLSTMATRKIVQYVQAQNSLKRIYIGNNNFTQHDLEIIGDALPTAKAKEHYRKTKFMEICL